MIILYDKEDID